MSAMTKKEWMASLQKAIDEFDWEAARESHSNTPVIDESAAKRIATALGWGPKREWVGLTEDEITQEVGDSQGLRDIIKNIEHKLKERNS